MWTRTRPWLGVALATALFAVVWARTAWLCDDAFITLRSVDHLVAGRGLVWNPGQRVQVFTHPLWMWILVPVHAVARSAPVTLLAPSFACSVAAFALAIAPRAGGPVGWVAAAALVSSRAIVDYASSGLENPLAYLLLAAFARATYAGARLPVLAGVAGLAALVRLDSALLFAPALLVGLRAADRRERWRAVALAAGPPVAWMAFSLFYFGFALPNTAPAKLGHGIARAEILGQGIAYVGDSLRTDPTSLGLLVLAAVLAARAPARARHASILTGAAAYLAYVVWIGGDFMSGRLVAAVALAGALVLDDVARSARPLVGAVAAGAIAVAALLGPHPVLVSGPGYGAGRRTWGDIVDLDGISDERAFWYGCAGLWSRERPTGSFDCGRAAQVAAQQAAGRRVVESGGVGFLGYVAGDDLVLLDPMGVTDPLLARLGSPVASRWQWRPGHLPRRVPEGYAASLASGADHFEDRALGRYWSLLSTVVSGPLWARDRLAAIVGFHLGAYDHLLPPVGRDRRYRAEPLASYAGDPAQASGPCNASRMWYYRRGVRVDVGESHARAVLLAANDDADYRLALVRDGVEVGAVSWRGDDDSSGTIRTLCREVPEEAVRAGFDEVRLRATRGDKSCFRALSLVDRCPPPPPVRRAPGWGE